MSKITAKQQIPTTKVIGLILSWDMIIILGDMIEWGDLSDPMFYSLIWLNAYLIITISDFKKTGMGFIMNELVNTFYNSTLTDGTKLERGKELLGMGADFVSMMSLKTKKEEKIKEDIEEIQPIE